MEPPGKPGKDQGGLGSLPRPLQLAVESAHLGFWQVDLATLHITIIGGNGPLSSLIPTQSSAPPTRFLDLAHPDDRETVERALRTAAVSGDYHAEFRVVLADGTIRWVAAHGHCLRDAAGKPTALIGVDLDIGARLRLEEQLRQIQKMEAIGQLAGGIAHDFNNLLTVIQGNASLLMDVQGLPDEDRTLVRQITEAAERASGLTHQLLLFGRKHPASLTLQDLNQIVGNITRMLRRVLGENIQLHAQLSEGLPAVRADVGLIEQVLLNLALNARDAMPDGGTLQLTTSLVAAAADPSHPDPDAAPGTQVCLEIRDTGHGISPEHLPRVFEPFFTTKDVGKGTGLGLATVYAIVKQHRGSIQVASQPGQGTSFQIHLPAAPSLAAELNTAKADSPLPRGNETVLVVEDEAPVRLLITNLLQRHGYNVVAATNGPEAIEVWKAHRDSIRLLLTDMVMPGGMTGRELAGKLHAENQHLHVIYTSGYSGDLLGKGSALVEGVNFLRKPYPAAKLLIAVRNSLDQK
jgi:two-component system cell cycle sensor histidine kinase/response regulator CckA